MNWYKKIFESEKNSSIITAMDKELILMRGVPGSGKSTLAKQLAGKTGQIFSADNFFIDENGDYRWNPDKIGEAHQWAQNQMKEAIDQGISPVILDNTNVSQAELRSLKPLVEYGISKGYIPRIEEPNTPWAFNAEELANRNTHGVPKEDIEEKLRKWVDNPSIDDILNNFGIEEAD